jgi:hypothetical protein
MVAVPTDQRRVVATTTRAPGRVLNWRLIVALAATGVLWAGIIAVGRYFI